MKALLLKAAEALKQGLRIEELGRREDVHWESLRDMRRAFHDQQLAAIADLEAAIREQPGEASGWKLVPVVPTAQMRDAAVQAICYGPEGGFTRISGPDRTWNAMLAVAPLKDEGEARPKDAARFVGLDEAHDAIDAATSGKAQP